MPTTIKVASKTMRLRRYNGPGLIAAARQGGSRRARLYSREWQRLLMTYARHRAIGRTRCRTFRAWLKKQGLGSLRGRAA